MTAHEATGITSKTIWTTENGTEFIAQSGAARAQLHEWLQQEAGLNDAVAAQIARALSETPKRYIAMLEILAVAKQNGE